MSFQTPSISEVLESPLARAYYCGRFGGEAAGQFLEQFNLLASSFQLRCSDSLKRRIYAALNSNTNTPLDVSLLSDDERYLLEGFVGILRSFVERLYALMPELQQSTVGNLDVSEGVENATQVRTDLYALLNTVRLAPRVCVVADRESDNLRSLVFAGNQDLPIAEVAGVITPFHDIDEELLRLATYMRSLEGVSLHAIPSEDGTVDFCGSGKFQHCFSMSHCPYDKDRFKCPETGAAARKDYCLQLLNEIRATSPDIVFLSNMKLILDAALVEGLQEDGVPIVNVHPSVLPLNKGFRTEKKALDGVNVEASGCTFHEVIPELDGGPTILTLRVPPLPIDNKMKEAMGAKRYALHCEEQMRLQIIRAQSLYTPEVLRYAADKNIKRKIVSDADAFDAEGRPGFESTDAYVSMLQEEHAHWQAAEGNTASFKEWFSTHRVPYKRVLFQHNGAFRTLEDILQVPDVIEPEPMSIKTEYIFTLQESESVSRKYRTFRLFDRLRTLAHGDARLCSRAQYMNGQCVIETSNPDFEAELVRRKIPFITKKHSVRVTAPRSPNPMEYRVY